MSLCRFVCFVERAPNFTGGRAKMARQKRESAGGRSVGRDGWPAWLAGLAQACHSALLAFVCMSVRTEYIVSGPFF